MRFVNVGIVAHVDAGKTSLTERLLFESGVVTNLGRVDRGTTVTDSMALERQRGMTIRSGIVCFPLHDLTVNLIDTPGHSDFVAEVERAVRVLDAAVLVISAVEGIQARTRVLLRLLDRIGLPTIVFINKVDRRGADPTAVLQALADLRQRIVEVSVSVEPGGPAARVCPADVADPWRVAQLVDLLAAHRPELLARYIADTAPSPDELEAELIRQFGQGLVWPVYVGSALRGSGITEFTDGLYRLLAPLTSADELGELKGHVFKVDRGRAGERIAYARIYGGRLASRDQVRWFRRDSAGNVRREGRVSNVEIFRYGSTTAELAAPAGSIAVMRGLADIRIGDQLGTEQGLSDARLFPPPALEVVAQVDPAHRQQVYSSLRELAELDPFIGVSQDPDTAELRLQLYGEVQKEILCALVLDQTGLTVQFEESTPLYVEKPTGTGRGLEQIRSDMSDAFWATVGLTIEPAKNGHGNEFRLAVELGSLPLAFHRAIEESALETLQQGIHGWPVIDCLITLTQTGYASPISAAGDFRSATPLVVAAALTQAGTQVCEPFHAFDLDLPANSLDRTLEALARARAVTREVTTRGSGWLTVHGLIPAASAHRLQRQLPDLTRGEGSFIAEFDGFRPVSGTPPPRYRQGANPFDRSQYMLHKRRTLRNDAGA